MYSLSVNLCWIITLSVFVNGRFVDFLVKNYILFLLDLYSCTLLIHLLLNYSTKLSKYIYRISRFIFYVKVVYYNQNDYKWWQEGPFSWFSYFYPFVFLCCLSVVTFKAIWSQISSKIKLYIDNNPELFCVCASSIWQCYISV